jgi:ubiquinone/menaquinone biosynthesis C-methylase UbiE
MEYHQNRYARALDSAAFPGCRWLDLGAGRRLHGGWLGRTAAEVAGEAGYVVGCDLVISHLRQHPTLTHRVAATGATLPFADAVFDLVTANMVLEHLATPAAVFAEVARVLSPGGQFVFVTPHLGHPVVRATSLLLHSRWRSWLAWRVERRSREDVFQTLYRANTLEAIVELAGASGLAIRWLERFSSFPFAGRLPVLGSIERWWIARIESAWGSRFRSNLVGILERPVSNRRNCHTPLPHYFRTTRPEPSGVG